MNEHQTKRFEHQELLDNLTVPCPPEDFEERETVAYRWVFETIADELNFVPQYLKNPRRFKLKEDRIKCIALGLSFFDSEKNARWRFEDLKKTLPEDVWHRMEKNIASGTLKPDFGVHNEPNHEGHFTFYPFEQIDLKQHFIITASL